MIRTYACNHCNTPLFTGDLKAMFQKRRYGAPDYIEMTCPDCREVSVLAYVPQEEVTKRRGRPRRKRPTDTLE